MPFVRNCICKFMKCKQYAATCISGGANGRGGGGGGKNRKDPKQLVGVMPVQRF